MSVYNNKTRCISLYLHNNIVSKAHDAGHRNVVVVGTVSLMIAPFVGLVIAGHTGHYSLLLPNKQPTSRGLPVYKYQLPNLFVGKLKFCYKKR